VADGSTDPTFGVDMGRNPPIAAYIGFSVTIPLRIFDKNQGEKQRTELDIRRNERLRDAAQAQVFSDVDSAYAMVNGNLNLLRPYKANTCNWRPRFARPFLFLSAWRSVAAGFLNAQNDYRSVQLNYLNLIGSYMTAASQLNLAVGREAIQ